MDEQYRVSALAALCTTTVAYTGFCLTFDCEHSKLQRCMLFLIGVARGLIGQPLILLWVRKRSTVVWRQCVSGITAQWCLTGPHTLTAVRSSAAWVWLLFCE